MGIPTRFLADPVLTRPLIQTIDPVLERNMGDKSVFSDLVDSFKGWFPDLIPKHWISDLTEPSKLNRVLVGTWHPLER